jgi:small GTP-binding protein
MTTYDYRFKLIVIGDSGVGKTTMLHRLENDKFYNYPAITIGIEYIQHRVKIDDKMIKLQIWDTAGQELYRSIIKSYFKGTAGALLCYDITNMQSFYEIDNWKKQVEYINDYAVPMLLIGLKRDLKLKRQVSIGHAEKYARDNNMLFLEISSKDNYEKKYKSKENITKCFHDLSTIIYNNIKDKTNIEEYGVRDISNKIQIKNNNQQCTICDSC